MSKTPSMALFCDEAGKETDRYLAVGGLVVASKDVAQIRNEFERQKKDLDIQGEVKWNKTKKGNRPKFQLLTHYAFELIRSKTISFHCLLVDFDRFDHALREDGGKNESLKRMYYQLILHRLGKKHGKTHSLYAFPDRAKELTGLDTLKQGLNNILAREYGCESSPLKAIELRASDTEPLLQLNDLILGAVCYQKNKRFDEDEAGQPKANLSGYVLGKSNLPHYDSDTPRALESFTIWNLKSQYLKGG